MNSDINKIVRKRKRIKTRPSMIKKRIVLAFLALLAVFISFEFCRYIYIWKWDSEKQKQAATQDFQKLQQDEENLQKQIQELKTIEGKKELLRNNGRVETNEVPIKVSNTTGIVEFSKSAKAQAPQAAADTQAASAQTGADGNTAGGAQGVQDKPEAKPKNKQQPANR